MKPISSPRYFWVAVAGWLALAFLAGTATAGEVPPQLFEIHSTWTAPEKADRNPVGAVQEVGITLDSELVDRVPDSLELPLADGRLLLATKTSFEATPSYLSWAGRVEGPSGETGFVHLVDHGDEVSAILDLGGEQFQIVAGEEGHRLVRIEMEVPSCGLDDPAIRHHFDPSFAEHDLGTDAGSAHLEGESLARSLPEEDALEIGSHHETAEKAITYIDVLAVYPSVLTGAAETTARNYMDAVVADANLIFANSNVNARYRLVAKERLVSGDQPPSSGIFAGLGWLSPVDSPGQDPDLLGPPEVLDLREEYAADMVALFVPKDWDGDNYCGVANLPLADGSNLFPGGTFGTRAFSVMRERCGRNDYTFAHELGHNYGLRHNDEDTSSSHLNPFGRGHTQSRTPWQSIANGTLELDVAGTFTVGYHFTPQVDGWVAGFGGLYQGTKNIYLWQDGVSSYLKRQAVPSTNSWNYVQFPFPIAVQAGQRYTVAVYTAGDGSIYRNPIPFPRTSGGITIHGTTSIPGFARPTVTDPTIMYGNVDIRFVPAAELANGTLGASVLACARTGATDICDEVCNRIPYLSDPNIVVNGLPTGTPTRNNAAAVRTKVGPYSAFRTNHAPVCQPDYLSTPADTPLSIGWGLLLGNDTDPDGDSLFVHDYDKTTRQGGSNDTGHLGGFNYRPPTGFTGHDWFFYTVGDRPRGHPAAMTDRCIVNVDVQGGPQQTFGQVGTTTLSHDLKTIFYGRTYTKPIVIAQMPSYNGTNPAVVRVTNVQNDRFSLYVDESPEQDGAHTGETVAYLVVEAGTWQTSDGSILRAGALQTSKTVGRSVVDQWQTVSYGGSFSSTPVFFSQVQTNADPSFVKTRQRNIGTSSALLGLEKAEVDAVSHGTETVGWLALEPGSGTWTGRSWVAGSTAAAVTHLPYTQTYGNVSDPRLFAAMSSFFGPDNAALRYTALGTTSFTILVEEETTLDPEMGHVAEVVDYLVLGGSGELVGTPQ